MNSLQWTLPLRTFPLGTLCVMFIATSRALDRSSKHDSSFHQHPPQFSTELTISQQPPNYKTPPPPSYTSPLHSYGLSWYGANKSYKSVFSIDGESGAITLTGQLDYEQYDFYSWVIYVRLYVSCVVIGLELVTWCDWRLVIGWSRRQ